MLASYLYVNLTDKHILLKSFGLHIRELRLKGGFTQIDVSSAMKRDQQSLQRVESGRTNPSLTYLLELAAALKISPSELINFEIKKPFGNSK